LSASSPRVEHYHKTFCSRWDAQEYLKKRGFTEPKLFQDFKLGYPDVAFQYQELKLFQDNWQWRKKVEVGRDGEREAPLKFDGYANPIVASPRNARSIA